MPRVTWPLAWPVVKAQPRSAVSAASMAKMPIQSVPDGLPIPLQVAVSRPSGARLGGLTLRVTAVVTAIVTVLAQGPLPAPLTPCTAQV